MHQSRRTLIVLVFAAALAALPTALSARQWSADAVSEKLRAWTQAWPPLGDILEWLTKPRPANGCSPDPNGGTACQPSTMRPAAARPVSHG